MKQRLLTLLIGFTLVACELEEAPGPVTPAVLQPSVYEETDYRREYSYNNANQLVQIKMISTFPPGNTFTSVQDFSYRTDGKIAEATSDTGFRFVYSYSGDRLVRTEEYVNGSWSKEHRFAYDSKGRVMEAITYQNIPEEGGIIPTSKDEYQYGVNDNLIEWRMYYYTSFGAEAKLLTVMTYSDYDDKINTDNLFEVNVYNPYQEWSTNNPGKQVVRNGAGIISSTEAYLYQYNDKGYVTAKTTQVTLYNGVTASYGSTYQFRD